MTTHLNFRIRTEESEEYSVCGSEFNMVEHSIDSISLADEAITMHIQHLQKLQEGREQERSKKTVSSRSHSYIYISDEQPEKKKSKSMKNHVKTAISLENVPHATMTQLLSYHRCPNLARNDVYNRAYGAMFGLLIGDSIGSCLVNRPYNQQDILNAIMMKGGGAMNLKSGEGTDQWEIALSLCEGLLDGKGKYDGNLVARRYLEWIDSNPCDLPVLMGIAFSNIKKQRHISGSMDASTLGQQLRASSLRNIKYQSVLGLVRIVPLTIWALKLEEYEFNFIIKEQMKLITPNEFVVETALVFANLLKCIILTGDHRLAYHQAAQHVHCFGSEKMIDLWSSIQERHRPAMTTATANNLKFPFLYAIDELLQLDQQRQDLKKSFISSIIRVLAKGFNTDTNCSIALSLIGASIGYNNIPSYFRSRIVNAQCGNSFRLRSRDYDSKRIVDVVANLLKQGPTNLEED